MRWARQQGFTIVELLIVIVVIGILAAITVVAFTGVQDRGHETALQSDLSNLAKKARAYHALEGRYPTSPAFFSASSGVDIAVTKSAYDTSVYNLYYCADKGTGERFGIAARSKSRKTYTVSSTSGVKEVGSMSPTWQVACGAFVAEPKLDDIEFTYGWTLSSETWRGALAN